jgi:hypothetical protein
MFFENNSLINVSVVGNQTNPSYIAKTYQFIDLNGTALGVMFEAPGGWNPTNGTFSFNVTYNVIKHTNANVTYKPDVTVIWRKRVQSDRLNETYYMNQYNVSLSSVLYDRWANFSSDEPLNWTTEEFDVRVVHLREELNVEEGGKPDLVIVGKDEILVENGYRVQYIIKNIGNATAPPGHEVALIVDGNFVENKTVPVYLSPGDFYTDTFNTVLPLNSPPNDTVTVIADYYNTVDELNESNNAMTNVFEYPPPPVVIIWNATISATNQLEPVVVGMHPNATDGYDSEFDKYTQTPIQGKVILILDDKYATNIKGCVPPGKNVTWNLSIGVPTGQTTNLTWNPQPHPQIRLRIFNGTQELTPGVTLGSGEHKLLVVAEVLEKISFTLHLKAGWNMVSIPIVPENSSVYEIFKGISTLDIRPVVTWQSPVFVQVTEIQPKVGYWVFTPQDMDIVVNGTPITDTNLTLKAGWNMIGTVGLENLNLSLIPNQVPQRPPVTWQSPIFVEVNSVSPGQAVWVFVTQDTEVEI